MLRSYMVFAGVAAGALGLSMAAINCGSSTDTSTGGSSTTGTTTGTTSTTGTGGGATTGSGTHAEPPGPPTGATAPDGTTDSVFAVSKLYLGDTDRDGTPDKLNGWKNFGFDIDGKISTATSTDLCKPQGNVAPKTVYPDGNNGIDNSFGKNILQVILGLSQNATQTINDDIAAGKFTIMFAMHNLGTGANYTPIMTGLYGGGDLMATPKWDGTDKWPVFTELLVGGDINKPKVHFDGAYTNANTWVSGGKGDVDLSLSVQGFTLTLTIGSAQIAMQLSDDHKKVTNGTIAGVLETSVLISEIKKVAGAFNAGLCAGPTIDSITSQLAQASDIMKDGTQDPTKTCDGISIGLGFDALPVQLGAVLPAAPPKTDPCSDAGAP